MKNIYLFSIVVLLCSAGIVFASDQSLPASEEADMERHIRELTAAVEDMRADMNEQARLRSRELERDDAGRYCYGRGHHSYDGCGRYRHHY